jgi:hypothetical protein
MSEAEVSDQPIIVASEVSDDGVKIATYTPRLDGTFDSMAEADMTMARAVGRVLHAAFPKYGWRVISEMRQGYVAFQIPELMGPTLHCFIRLADFGRMNDKLILYVAGETLERMGLPRDKCDMELYRAARFRLGTFQFDDVKGRKN